MPPLHRSGEIQGHLRIIRSIRTQSAPTTLPVAQNTTQHRVMLLEHFSVSSKSWICRVRAALGLHALRVVIAQQHLCGKVQVGHMTLWFSDASFCAFIYSAARLN